MTDLRTEITNYGLRLINDTPAGQPIVRSRRLLLTPKPNEQKVNQINLLFRDNGPASVGNIQRLTDGNLAVRVYLPYDEFSVYYTVLQTEKPVRAQLIFDGDVQTGQPIPVRFAMLYVDEPVGEGPRDN